MKNTPADNGPKALVLVLDDIETANEIAAALQSQGFDSGQIEFVTHDIHEEAPQVETPKVHETTATAMIDGATKWGALGAGAGVLAGLLTPFPGAGLAMLFMGGFLGGAMGGIAGLDHATEDDSVDLPTLKEYEQLVKAGENLLVVLGTHDEVMRGEAIVDKMYHVRTHIHQVHGHAWHEHPANLDSDSDS